MINTLLVALTLIAHILLVVFLLSRFNTSKKNAVNKYIQKNGLYLSLLVSAVSMLGSLYYSEIMSYDPCRLCWLQRIFMYPQVFLLGLAVYRKDKNIIDYSMLLLGLGWVISLYHNLTYYNSKISSVCSIDGLTGCNTRYVFELGYISIPLMALTAFTLMIGLLFVARKKQDVVDRPVLL